MGNYSLGKLFWQYILVFFNQDVSKFGQNLLIFYDHLFTFVKQLVSLSGIVKSYARDGLNAHIVVSLNLCNNITVLLTNRGTQETS